MRVSYSPHAEEMLAERRSDAVEPDPKHPDRVRVFKALLSGTAG
jgi:hypothetical protein